MGFDHRATAAESILFQSSWAMSAPPRAAGRRTRAAPLSFLVASCVCRFSRSASSAGVAVLTIPTLSYGGCTAVCLTNRFVSYDVRYHNLEALRHGDFVDLRVITSFSPLPTRAGPIGYCNIGGATPIRPDTSIQISSSESGPIELISGASGKDADDGVEPLQ